MADSTIDMSMVREEILRVLESMRFRLVVDTNEDEDPDNMPPMKVGAACWRRGESANQSAQKREEQVGLLTIRRVYDSGVPVSFNDTDARDDYEKGRSSFYSCKPNIPLLAAEDPDEIARIEGLLVSWPEDHETIFAIQHEPEDEVYKSNVFTSEQWRRAQAVFNAMLAEHNNDLWSHAIVLRSTLYDGANGWNPDDFWSPCDVLAVDGYSWPYQGFPDAESVFGAAFDYADSKGVRPAIAECATDEDPNDPDHKPRWITETATYAAQRDAVVYCYFDCTSTREGKEDANFLDTSSSALEAFRQLLAKEW